MHSPKFKFKLDLSRSLSLSLCFQCRHPPALPRKPHRLRNHHPPLGGSSSTWIPPSRGSRPTTASSRPPWPSASHSQSPKSSPLVASLTERAPSSKPSSASASMSARSRWALAAPSSSKCSTTPPLSNLAAASR